MLTQVEGSHVTWVGWKKKPFKMQFNLYRPSKAARKIGQSSHSGLVYFWKVSQNCKGSIHSHVMWRYDFFSRPGIPLPLPLPTKGRSQPRRSSELITSVGKPYQACSLTLMEPHANLLLLNNSLSNSTELLWSWRRAWVLEICKRKKKHIFEGQIAHVPKKTGESVDWRQIVSWHRNWSAFEISL